jgi:hypothetical protein
LNDPVVYEVEHQDIGLCKQKEEERKETKNHNIHISRTAFESVELRTEEGQWEVKKKIRKGVKILEGFV